jgi:hypothetical protein
MAVELTSDQLAAVDKLRTGSILCGGVGSGKTRTALTYYYTKVCDGELKINGSGKTTIPKKKIPLYVITTGKTRDEENWQKESLIFYDVNPIVDSWNNIKKYRDVKHAFFVFDEQRVVGYGEWSKTFIHIARNNDWILLSATPGDTWIEYAPVMIANGYYKNLSDFRYQHVVYSRYTKYPKIERYVNTGKLERLRSKIVIKMDDRRITIPHDIYVKVDYNKELFEQIDTKLFDSINNKPIRNASELCSTLRRIVNSDHSRIDKVVEILSSHPKVIIFYNFNYELEMLIDLMEKIHYPYSQWNGHKHEPIPRTDQWAYLVQYSAGAEGWNCIETDTILYFSQNYSYKIMEQASGRINRMNTPFIDLYYYHLISDSKIDIAIRKALKNKKRFNERAYYELPF